MSIQVFYIMGGVMAIGIMAMAYVIVHVVRNLVAVTRSIMMNNDRRRIDTDRMVMQHIEKLTTEKNHQLRLAEMHANEDHKKWYLSQKHDQLTEGEIRTREQVLETMVDAGNGVGTRGEATPFDLGGEKP